MLQICQHTRLAQLKFLSVLGRVWYAKNKKIAKFFFFSCSSLVTYPSRLGLHKKKPEVEYLTLGPL
jgi:hypothetical protein